MSQSLDKSNQYDITNKQISSKMKKKKSFLKGFIDEVKKNIDVDSISENIKNVKNELQENLKDVKSKFQENFDENSKEVIRKPKPSFVNEIQSSKNKKEITFDYINIDEVTIIVKPKVISSPRIKGETHRFYDLSGNRVTKIPKGKRDMSIKNDCYLGLKKYDKVERWLPINPDEVERNLDDDNFILNHSKTKIKTEKTNKLVQKDRDNLDKLLLEKHKLTFEINEIKKSRQIKSSIILKESFLNKIPITLNFTKVISSHMTLIQNDLTDKQINKLTRFLSFLEKNEEKYNSLYIHGVNIYQKEPDSHVFQQISYKYLSILNYYQIFTLMLNNINTDKIKFNRLFNIIEDEGIFMTKSEVQTLNYFEKITQNISDLNQNLISEFKKLNEGISNLNTELQFLDGSLHMIDSTLGLIEKNTDNIYLSI